MPNRQAKRLKFLKHKKEIDNKKRGRTANQVRKKRSSSNAEKNKDWVYHRRCRWILRVHDKRQCILCDYLLTRGDTGLPHNQSLDILSSDTTQWSSCQLQNGLCDNATPRKLESQGRWTDSYNEHQLSCSVYCKGYSHDRTRCKCSIANNQHRSVHGPMSSFMMCDTILLETQRSYLPIDCSCVICCIWRSKGMSWLSKDFT